MTETNAIGAGIGGDGLPARARPARAAARAVLDLRVVDEAGARAARRRARRAAGARHSMFRGYWNRPEANAAAFVDGDWFRTGDVAIIDDEGFLFIVDRIKDLIIRGGENIGCGHVEAALLMHPDVHEAAVYAVPDERLGEEVGATVYGDASLDLDELRAFLASTWPRFEMPRYFACGRAAAAHGLGQDPQAPDPRRGAGRARHRHSQGHHFDMSTTASLPGYDIPAVEAWIAATSPN